MDAATDEKPLAAASAAAQDTQHNDVNREDRNVRRRTRRRSTPQKTKLAHPENLPFAERLSAAMDEKKMSPSDLAKLVWGTTKDRRGYIVARNRDRIGHYLAGTSYPDQANLEAIAEALDIPVEELAIERPIAARKTTQLRHNLGHGQELLVTRLPAAPPEPSRYRVQVDQVIPSPEMLIQLIELLEKAKLDAPLIEPPGDRRPAVGDVINGGKA